MKRSTTFSTLVVLGAASIGILASLNSWGGRIFITHSQANSLSDRLPASIRRGANVSALDGPALTLASQKHLLEEMQVVTETDRVGIQLGHFLTKNEDGNAAYACDVYKQITLSFVGEGIADSGDKPVVEITAPCEETADSNRMVPVWIPLHELRARSPSNADLPTGATGTSKIKFQNIGTEWPSQWALQGVRLSRSEDTATDVSIGAGAASEGAIKADLAPVKTQGEDLAVSGDELRRFVKKPVVIHW